MAIVTRRLLPALLRTRGLSTEKSIGAAAVVGSHTAKWMQDDRSTIFCRVRGSSSSRTTSRT